MTYSVFTDKGNRNVNEDSVGAFVKDDAGCFILCDGLGGHGMGDAASSLVVDVFKNRFNDVGAKSGFIGETFGIAQDMLLMEQKRIGAEKKMKTTGVSVVTDGKNVYVGHIGDSRAYIFSKNKVKCRTLDHSIPQMLVLSGEIKESEIRNHPDRSALLRVIGVEWDEPMYEIMRPVSKRKCQAMLLCSDGFWELIDEEKMCELLRRSENVDEWLKMMVDIVKENGIGRDMDNYSAIAVWMQ
ncbi:MAG: protein phosphatase 2C domain-containing protein [Oscillospiraceae bacterium]|nr:protein phosphatase 2C domain-containing protein [Oscillospiraceae bacterium]